MSTSSKLEAALAYASAGIHVFPLGPNSKVPAISKENGGRGMLDATTDEHQIRRWWREGSDRNIGIATEPSGLVVLDVDSKYEGDQTLAALGLSHDRDYLSAPMTRTPGGGRHFYFSADPSRPLTTRAHALGKGLDIRAVGGSIVAPPSVIDGKTYRWSSTGLEQPVRNVLEDSLPMMPDWMYAAAGETHLASRGPRVNLSEALMGIPEGQRNETLFKTACLLFREGMSSTEVWFLLEVAAEKCGFPRSELLTVFESASRYRTSATPALQIKTLPSKTESPSYPTHALPPVLHDLALQAARAVGVPVEMTAPPLLAMFGACIGRGVSLRLKESWREYPVLWVATVASSGTAKTPALKAVSAPFALLQVEARSKYQADRTAWEDGGSEGSPPTMDHLVTTDATMEAISRMLLSSRGLAYTSDELGAWLRGFDGYSANSKGKGDRQRWLSIWSSQLIKVDRISREGELIETPTVAVVGGIQPGILPSLALSTEDGLVPRFLFSVPEVKAARPNDFDLDRRVIDAVAHVARTLRTVEEQEVSISKEARDIHTEYANFTADLADATQEESEKAILAKLASQVLRVALILHCAQHPERPADEAVTSQTMQNAREIVEYHRFQAAKALAMKDPTSSPTSDRIYAALADNCAACSMVESDGWTSLSVLSQRLHLRTSPRQVLRAMVADGLIEERRLPPPTSGGRETMQYRHVHPEERVSDGTESMAAS